MSQSTPSLQAKFRRFFRKRELYLRSDGHIHYIALEPYMLMVMVGLVATLLSITIIGGAGYLMAGNTVTTLRANLNRNIEPDAFSSEKPLSYYQNKLKIVSGSTTEKLKTQKNKYEAEVKKLRDAYELQLAQFQSSLSQVNGRMVKNQDAYLKELERLRIINAGQKFDTNLPAKR